MDLNWKHIFKNPFIYTKDSKLQWLQYRINNRILGIKNLLRKMGIVSDNRCSFCQHEDETIVHLSWECIQVQTFMAEFKTICRQIINNEPEFSKAAFILGSQYIQLCMNVTFIIATSYIFSC